MSDPGDRDPAAAGSGAQDTALASTFSAVATDAPTLVAREAPLEWLLAWDDGSPAAAEGAERYELRGELARGGLGRIHFAWDRRLGRAVAIKEPLTAGARARFYREALLTARLQHPGIVPIYDAGNAPDGAPYYAMRLLGQGRSFTDAIAAASGLDERLTLLPHVIAAADAVAYAHGQRIIHRDLKPDNILLGPFGETVVIDWGLAKDLNAAEPVAAPGPAAAEAPGAAGEAAAPGASPSPDSGSRSPSRLSPLTLDGTTVGTPAYMSPEQVFQGVVDERTDVYSLGMVLLELLAGKRSALAGRQAMSPAELRRGLPPGVPADLVAIVGKAVAEEPEDRYPSARELAADLWRFAAGQLVKAHVYSPAALVRRWISRHRWPVGIAALSLLLLAALGTASVRGIIHQRNLAEAARERAETNNDALTLVQTRTSLDRDPTAALAWLKTYRPEGVGQDLVRSLAADAAARGVARHALPFGDRVRAVGFARGGALLVAADYAHTLRLFDTREGTKLGEWERPGGTTLLEVIEDPAAAPSAGPTAVGAPIPAGLKALTGGVDGRLLLFDLASGAVRTFTGHSAAITGLIVLADRNTCLSAARDGSVWRWDLAAGSGRQLTRHRGRVSAIALAADESWAVSAGVDRQLHLIDLRQEGPPRIFDSGFEVAALAMAPMAGGGHRLAAAGGDHRVRLWELPAPRLPASLPANLGTPRIVTAHGGIVADLAFSPDGALLASASRDRTVHLAAVDGERPGEPRIFTGHTDDIETVLFSPDGRLLVSAGLDGAIRLVELASGRQRALAGSRLMVERLVFSPGGDWLAAGTQDQDVRVWHTRAEPKTVLAGHGNDVDALLFLPPPGTAPGVPAAPSLLVSAGHDRSLRRWRRRGEGWEAAGPPLEGHQQTVDFLAALPGGRRVISGSADQTLRIWDLDTGKSEALAGHGNAITGIAVADGGRSLLSSSLDGTIRVWSLTADGRGELRHVLSGHRGAVQALALSPDERWLATGGDDRKVLLWDWREGASAGELVGHDDQIAALAFSPDGRSLASGAWNGGLKLWQGEGFRQGRALPGHTERVRGLVFSPGGETLASSSIDHSIRLWQIDAGRTPGATQVRVLRGHEASVRHLAFSPDGRLLSSSSTDRTARLWDAASGELRALRRYDGIVTVSAFSADGQLLAVGGWDKLVHVYPLEPAELIPSGPGSTRRYIESLTSATTDRDGRIATRSPGL